MAILSNDTYEHLIDGLRESYPRYKFNLYHEFSIPTLSIIDEGNDKRYVVARLSIDPLLEDSKATLAGTVYKVIEDYESKFNTVDWIIEDQPLPGQFKDVKEGEDVFVGGGKKFDQEKLRYDLIPPELLEETSKILTSGANKYGERNWEKGMDWSRPFGALQRHMWAWWNGEDKDPETGESHLSHAACCIAFLITYEQRQVGKDNRPTQENME